MDDRKAHTVDTLKKILDSLHDKGGLIFLSESRKYIEYGKILDKGFRDGLKEIHVDSGTEVIKLCQTKKAPEELPRL